MKNFKNIYSKYLNNCLAMSLFLAFLLNLIIESLARKSLMNGLDFIADSPLVFFYNVLIIFTTLSIALLFKRRIFVYVLVSIFWLALAVANGIILLSRMTPFTMNDLAVFKDGLSIVTNYLSTTEIALAISGVVILITLLTLLFFFAPRKKQRINYKKNIALLLAIILGMLGLTQLAIKTKVVDTFFGNLPYAYRDFGVPYCFINTWLVTGIGTPMDYSKENIIEIFKAGELNGDNCQTFSFEDDGKEHPNIIMLQLESFIDPLLVKTIELSSDPIPYFRELKEKYSSGYLTVPAVGAGTANTEFEALTGMSVKFFGPGEYPYKSILDEQTCESLPYDLKDLGYSAHAIHNHRGIFYGRNKVFADLGFDTFTSLEYMNNVVKTPKNWAKDAVLTNQILDALNSTENEDFIYTVSVQGHGKYPMEKVLQNPEIEVTKAPTEELRWQYEYYVNQIYEMDLFVKALTDALEEYDEDVILVMYGDHLPALEMTEEEMENGSIYETEYIMWDNFNLKKEDKPLCSYQLGAEILTRLDIHDGTLVTHHQNHQNSQTYLQDLKLLQYDMLYGQKFIYGESDPFEPTHLQMGINPIVVDEVVQIGHKYYLKGKNFTEFSKISLDGEILDTIYLGPTVLGLLEKVSPEDVERMKISQVEKNKEILSTTE